MNADKLIKDLNGLGIMPSKVHHNLSYEELFKYETSPELKDYAKVFVTKSGAVAVDTGIFTGRSPKDKYVVYDDTTKDTVWWKNEMNKNSDNKPMSTEVWTDLKQQVTEYLNGKELFVMDAFVGASEKNRLPIRVITDIAWAAHFVKNMFIIPTEKELENFSPEFIMLHAPRVTNKRWQEHKL
ncbi:MAG TPA: phosphoenolpyruvate carboxykinase (ATP), partial [Bacteroidales bacterium]|nr:phosphoenolpyruvate carboxykinase (ATP) [Bacteroidales bacterium]